MVHILIVEDELPIGKPVEVTVKKQTEKSGGLLNDKI